MNLNLDAADRDLLLMVLEDRLGTLREQVHHSMTSTFTDQLKETETRLRRLIERLKELPQSS
jgi:hypothetical protein